MFFRSSKSRLCAQAILGRMIMVNKLRLAIWTSDKIFTLFRVRMPDWLLWQWQEMVQWRGTVGEILECCYSPQLEITKKHAPRIPYASGLTSAWFRIRFEKHVHTQNARTKTILLGGLLRSSHHVLRWVYRSIPFQSIWGNMKRIKATNFINYIKVDGEENTEIH